MARKIKDRAAAAGPADLLSGPSQGKGTQARAQVARDVPCPNLPHPGTAPPNVLDSQVGLEWLTAPLARRASQLLEAAA